MLDDEGNRFWRLVAPAGTSTIQLRARVRDSGLPEPVEPGAAQVPVEELPELCYPYLRASRYCESDLLAPMAWSLFGATPPGWERVQAICDWVHRRLIFDESAASSTKTATEALREGRGVCRDFAHLAVAFAARSTSPPATAPGTWATPVWSRVLSRSITRAGSRPTWGVLVHLRRTHQPAPHRPGAGGARPRCRRCADPALLRQP